MAVIWQKRNGQQDGEQPLPAWVTQVNVMGESWPTCYEGGKLSLYFTQEQSRAKHAHIKQMADDQLAGYIAKLDSELEKISSQRLTVTQRLEPVSVVDDNIEQAIERAENMLSPEAAGEIFAHLDRQAFVLGWLRGHAMSEHRKREQERVQHELGLTLEKAVKAGQLEKASKDLGDYLQAAYVAGMAPNLLAIEAHQALERLLAQA